MIPVAEIHNDLGHFWQLLHKRLKWKDCSFIQETNSVTGQIQHNHLNLYLNL